MANLFHRRRPEDGSREVSVENPLPVTVEGIGPLYLFDDNGATSTSAMALTGILGVPAAECVEIVVQNDPDNTVDVLVGNANSQSVQLRPGEAETIASDKGTVNLSRVFVKSVSATPSINVHALMRASDQGG